MNKFPLAILFLLFTPMINAQPSNVVLNNPLYAVTASGSKQLDGTVKELLDNLGKVNNSILWMQGKSDSEWILKSSKKDTARNTTIEGVWTFRILSIPDTGKPTALLEHLAINGKEFDTNMLWPTVDMIFRTIKSTAANAGKNTKGENADFRKAKQDTTTEIFLISDDPFSAHGEGSGTDVNILSVIDTAFTVKGNTIAIGAGRMNLWCNGAKHTWIGTLTYKGYIFKSDKDSPLQFEVKEGKGYAYRAGKGSVTFPNGKINVLPPPVKK